MSVGLRTPLTELLGIKHPVMLAGMGSVSSHELVAAVSNAGGIGTIGGGTMTVAGLKREIQFTKELLKPGMKFGVDLMIPQLGGGARKTNKDYTKGGLDEMVDIMIREGVSMFVCAVGVPPRWLVDKLHAAGIPVMNMIGEPHHVAKALEAGVDMICAQGSEAGGHTGKVMTLPLIPQVVDLCRGKKNYFGSDVLVVAAGGLFDGRGLAASLALGAAGCWVGTRFIASPEAATSKLHRNHVLAAKSVDTTQTLVYTGRPCRVARNPYLSGWDERQDEVKELTGKGVVPWAMEFRAEKATMSDFVTQIMGQAAGGVTEIRPAGEIVESFVAEAVEILQRSPSLIAKL